MARRSDWFRARYRRCEPRYHACAFHRGGGKDTLDKSLSRDPAETDATAKTKEAFSVDKQAQHAARAAWFGYVRRQSDR
jgi:hypothetical protein